MLKETVICIIIIIAILFGNNVTQNYTKESVNELSNSLLTLRENIKKEEIENIKLKQEMNDIYQSWRNRYNKLAYFIEHDELEKVDTSLIEIKSNVETEEYNYSISEIDKSIFVLEHIEDKYALNLQNIF